MTPVQIHTVLDPVSGRWRNRLGAGRVWFAAADSKAGAVAAGRRKAAMLGAEHLVHNEDGTVSHQESFAHHEIYPVERPRIR